jgi:hypothetical protein
MPKKPETKMRYQVTPCVRIDLRHEDSRHGRLGNDEGFVIRFSEWLRTRYEGCMMRDWTTGPGLFHGSVMVPLNYVDVGGNPDAAQLMEEIEAWLMTAGATEDDPDQDPRA